MKTKIIGLTGGIGSGKTTVAGYFAALGVPVYIADEEAKKLLFLPETVAEVMGAFGSDVLSDGLPDRKKLAGLVFNNPQKLAVLNGIIHPKVKEHFAEWVSGHYDKPCVIKEAAILFESGSYKDCDAVILVTAPKEIRIQRVMKRDNVSETEVLARMERQWDDERKAALSDYIIINVDKEEARLQATEIFKIVTKNEG